MPLLGIPITFIMFVHAVGALKSSRMDSTPEGTVLCSKFAVQESAIRSLKQIPNSLLKSGTAKSVIKQNTWPHASYLPFVSFFIILIILTKFLRGDNIAFNMLGLVFISIFTKLIGYRSWNSLNDAFWARPMLQRDRKTHGRTYPQKQWTLPGKCFILMFVCLCCLSGVSAQVINHEHDFHRRRLSNKTEEYTTPSSRYFTVPVGVTMLSAVLAGGSGATVTTSNGNNTGVGGTGNTIMVNIPVTPGEVLQVNIAGNGGTSGPGFNGGGAGCTENPNQPSGGGGGATDIRRTPYGMSERLAVAGGGGGGSSNFSANGGNGGYPVADGGYAGFGPGSVPSGGTGSSGGTVLTPFGCTAAGAPGFGGSCCNGHGGGGGAGYYGGASSYLAGGGGGSSYVDTSSDVELVYQDYSFASGYVLLEYTNFDPTIAPTASPSAISTSYPTSQPSSQPSGQPSSVPSRQPTVQPSSQPSLQPSGMPSSQPTTQPSSQPSVLPTSQPSGAPSAQPSSLPSSQPSGQPTSIPTTQPTTQPSSKPSSQPSSEPTGQPSAQPSTQPSSLPSMQPSVQPSARPSSQRITQPTSQPSSLPSVQPSGQPTTQPTSQPTNQPSHIPTSIPSNKPSTQPSSQPSSSPSTQPTVQPSQQPSSQPLAAPTSTPTTLPTQVLTAREYAHLLSVSHTIIWSQVANILDSDWGCGTSEGESVCVTLSPSGIFQTQYNFRWNTITSALQTNDPTTVILSGLIATTNIVSTDIALCEILTTHLLCTVKSFPDTRFVAGSFAPSVSKLVYVGTSSGLATVSVLRSDLSGILNFRYTNSLGLVIWMSHVQSPPNYIGSFIAGTCTTTGFITYIFAAVVRTDSGAMTAMYVTPVNGAIVNSAELVKSMALEYTQPDSFIAGGLQTIGEPTISAYFVCVNTLYQSVNYGRLFRFKQSVVNGVRRKLTVSTISSSVVKSLVRVDVTQYLLVSWNMSMNGSALNRISIVKTSLIADTILQQVHVMSNTSSIYCSHLNSAGLFLTIACTVQYSINNTRSLLLSVDRQLTFSQLPDGYTRHDHEIFLSESVAFQRTKVPVTVDSTVIATSDYTFSTIDGSPTVQPTIITTSKPSIQPSEVPSSQPSSSPSAAPSVSAQPSSHPSSSGPINTYKPTVKPTLSPTRVPTVTPTRSPTAHPTVKPTARPSTQPSRHPSTQPSVAPTIKPTRAPQSQPTFKPSAFPSAKQTQTPSLSTAILAASGRTSSGYSETVFILLYVLGSITAAYGLYRLFHCYIQTLDDFAWQRKMRAHLKAVQLSLAGQPTHIPNLAKRLAQYKRTTKKTQIVTIVATTTTTTINTLDGELMSKEVNSHSGVIDGAPTVGAYINSPVTKGAYINSPTISNNNISMPTCTSPNSTAICRLPTVHSTSSSSLEISSLHSSEMSDYDISEYHTSLHHDKSKENAMEEGSA